ncbi:hypothetical protein Ade02nite_62350 [Paractinoplanes deccanensis]|uniref:DUF202 domain-containing protein n=1 Tax=Paractinoplanes deccanensis TaxID=113561 RepID=A0ABQ3YC94_9ACTN|nr:DUF202 domain-containing protein [Actinoplanes deccanensis]GID77594.1 hypothetical protein Ade02nite_62350 [Actinoplanes deccanensis]
MSGDPGAAAERTRLAWRRTALSAAAVALLALRPVVTDPTHVGKWIATSLIMVGWAAMVGIAYRRAKGLTSQPPRPARRTVPAFALIALAFAVLGGLVIAL